MSFSKDVIKQCLISKQREVDSDACLRLIPDPVFPTVV